MHDINYQRIFGFEKKKLRLKNSKNVIKSESSSGCTWSRTKASRESKIYKLGYVNLYLLDFIRLAL